MRARDNPFAVHRLLQVRYRLDGPGWDELLHRLAALRFRAAVIGPHGHGKTTLLEEIGSRLAGRGFRVRDAILHTGDRRLTAGQRQELFAGLTRADLLLIDGAEQLGTLSWLELRTRSRAAGGLVITSHRPGLLPTLYECRTTPELLADIVDELLAAEASPVRPDSAEVFVRHRGNLRDALRELYDLAAAVGEAPARARARSAPLGAGTRTRPPW